MNDKIFQSEVPMFDPEVFRYQNYYEGIDKHLSTYVPGEVPACTYTARLIVETLQKYNIASRILWLANRADETGHAYVVIEGQQLSEDPYNLPEDEVGAVKVGDLLTDDGQVRANVEDITEELMTEEWIRL